MAQLVEHVIGNDEVISSTLIASSRTRTAIAVRVLCFKRELQHLHPDSCACADSPACEGQRVPSIRFLLRKFGKLAIRRAFFGLFPLCDGRLPGMRVGEITRDPAAAKTAGTD